MLLGGLTLRCVVPHLIARRNGRSPWPQYFLRRATHHAGFDIRIEGTPLLHDVFFVSNHLSWIDILAMGGTTGCAFISKDDVKGAPIVGWLAAQNNTIFVARQRRGEVSGQIDAVRDALAAHQPIALFPEGTTGDGKALLPFKPALFSVLLPPPRAILIQPVVIDYGDAAQLVAWADGESGIANARRILGARGRRTLTLHFLEPFDPGDHPDRKALSAESRARIEAALAGEM
ncbi:lysophospholipid acyltransferase family protein [Sphingobium xanthum]|uniref:lysophospholipid acyltransferase family protein n=1 Tax=Sphingobium xanthum TaxID=1387165 RepID=UPI001C8BD65E|nr:lysophospholipid acyltransferase family protein [Sphingobium xanthum]